jgi:hypothetical protein
MTNEFYYYSRNVYFHLHVQKLKRVFNDNGLNMVRDHKSEITCEISLHVISIVYGHKRQVI